MLIIDTDVGSDPDDAVALVVAARRASDLAVVVTNDEVGGERARLARHLLDLVGRPDVPVVAGTEAAGAPAMVVSAPAGVREQRTGVRESVLPLVARSGEPVRWLGIGAMTNLAAVLEALARGPRGDLSDRLRIVQMGGALDYRHPDRAEHNLRRDPAAVATVLRLATELRLVHPPSFVLSDHTFREEIGIHSDTAFYRHWSRPDAAGWEVLLREHHDGFFARNYPQSLEHDPLALSAILDEPWVTFIDATIALDGIGRMTLDTAGSPVRLSHAVDYAGFLEWLGRCLGAPGPTYAA